MIKREIIDHIREQSDIVQVIAEYLPLKKAGKYYKTLCPFHNEKSPSFYVSPERQIYHCFGCGAGGSVYTFLMQYEKLSFPEAIKKLASKLGITIEEEKIPSRYQMLYNACEFATKFYSDALQNSKLATEYLKYREINQETITRFRLGYAPSGNHLFNTAKKHGISEEILLAAGLVVKKEDGYHDWFFNRIIFPVFSISGKVIGFGARALDDMTQPKYINSPETAIFRKGENLYGLFQAKNYLYQNIPILVEGNFDLLSLSAKGINNVLAPLGTALTSDQALLIRRFSNQVIIAFDPDPAGQTATLRTIETMLQANLDPHIIMLPEGFDPDKFIKTFGKEKFETLIKNNLDFIDFILKVKDINSITGKKNCLNEIIRLLSIIDENISQELYINKVSEVFSVTKQTILNQVHRTTKKTFSNVTTSQPSKRLVSNLIEEQIISVIATFPEYALIAKQEIPAFCFSNSETQELIQIIYDNVESENFSLAKLIDTIEKPELKKLVADLSFRIKALPTKSEFKRKLQSLKAAWYYRAILDAQAKGDNVLLEKLTQQHYNLKKILSQKRSRNNAEK